MIVSDVGLLGGGAHRDIGLPGWGWKDPSRTGDFNTCFKGEALAGLGSKIRLGARVFNSYSEERRSLGWDREDPSWSRGFSSYSKERRSRLGLTRIRLGTGVLVLILRRGWRSGLGLGRSVLDLGI